MKLGGVYVSVGAKVDSLKRDLAKAEGLVGKSGVVMKRTLGNISFAQVGIAAAAAVGSMVLLEKKIISIGREFETNMKTVQAWSGATGQELKDLTDIARKMGATTEWTASQAAGALKYMAAAGFTAKESIAALPGTLDLATAGQVDLATATDITTDVLTAFGLGVEDLSRVNDAFINTTSNSNTNVNMLGQSMKMVAPTAKLFGLSIEETSAFLGTLANAGVKAEMAGSGLNMALLRTSKAAKMLGMDAMTPLIDVLKEMKKQQWDATKIGEAFGARQVKTAGILMDNIGNYEGLNQIMAENAGATQELADIIRDSLDNDMKILASTIEGVLLDAFDRNKDSMREVVQGITGWINENKILIGQLVDFSHNVLMVFIDGIHMAVDAFMALVGAAKTVHGWLDKIASLLPEASSEADIFWEKSDKVTTGLRDESQAMKHLLDTTETFGDATRAGSKTMEQFNDEVELAKKVQTAAAKEVKKTTKEIDAEAKAVKKAADEWNKLWSKMAETGQYDELADDYDAFNKYYIEQAKETAEEVEKITAEEANARIQLEEKALSSMTRSNENYFEYKLNSLDREKQKYEDLYGKDLPWITEAFAQKYIDLENEKLKASGNFFDGMKAYLNEAAQDWTTFGDIGYNVMQTFSDKSETALSDGLFAFLNNESFDWKETWKGIWEDCLKTFTDALAEMAMNWVKMLAKMVADWAMSGLADLLGFGGGGGCGGGGGGGLGSAANIAEGAAGAVDFVASGGSVTQAGSNFIASLAGAGSASYAAYTAGTAVAGGAGAGGLTSFGLTSAATEAALAGETVAAGGGAAGGGGAGGAGGLGAAGVVAGMALIAYSGFMASQVGQQYPTAGDYIRAWEQGLEYFTVPGVEGVWKTPQDASIPFWKNQFNDWLVSDLAWGSTGSPEGGEGLPTWLTDGLSRDYYDAFMSNQMLIDEYIPSMYSLPKPTPDYMTADSTAHAMGGPLLANEMYWPSGGGPGGEGLFWGAPGEGVVSQSGMQKLAEINSGSFTDRIINAVNSAGGGSDRPINLYQTIVIDGHEIVNVVAKYGPGDAGFREMIGGIPH